MVAQHSGLNVAVITLARRPERLAAFDARWRSAGHGLGYTVHLGVDTGTAAGCLASHLQVLSSYTTPVLVLEDDACFAPEFDPYVEPPHDWHIAWLGGQHRLPPIAVNDRWTRPRYLVRTHAYIARHPAVIAAWLYAANPPRIDPFLAALPVQQYALKQFTVGQTAGVSDIDGRVRESDEFWNRPFMNWPRHKNPTHR